jgi:hypothetical protein
MAPTGQGEQRRNRLFLSDGRRDAADFADCLCAHLEKLGYEFWQDTRRSRADKEWKEQIADGVHSTQVAIVVPGSPPS